MQKKIYKEEHMKNINMKNIGALIFTSLLFFIAQLQAIVIDSRTIDSETANPNQSIIDIVESTPDLSTFLTALNAAGLTSLLEGNGPWTIFAPSNEAFAALPKNIFQDLMREENKAKLATLLKNHIVNGLLLSNTLNAGNINSLGGKPVHIEVRGSQITVDHANIVQVDLVGSNGVIQIIDAVLHTQ